jgi:predicted nucleotidyltransferase
MKNSIREEILKRLKNTEEKEGVRIIMAIESGSRAWGFASPNSDYDVRFIYIREKNWYERMGCKKGTKALLEI